jgi:hypothetical protein
MSLNVLVSYQSSSQPLADVVIDAFKSAGFDEVYTITESAPDKLATRAQLVNACDTFVVLATRNYQKSEQCMELINYAKDVKKNIYGVCDDESTRGGSYVPFGALGAILCGSNGCITQTKANEQGGGGVSKIKLLAEAIKAKAKPKPTKHTGETRMMTPIGGGITFDDEAGKVDVLVSHHPEMTQVAALIMEALSNNNNNDNKDEKSGATKIKTTLVEDSTCGRTSVRRAKVLIVVMSAGYEANRSCRAVIEAARSNGCVVVPVSTSREWKPAGWLGLMIAGKRFYRIFDREQAYVKKYDSTPMNELLFEVNKALAARPTLSEREKALLDSLRARVDECKAKLQPHWPPNKHERKRVDERKPVKVKLAEPKADIEYTHIHYEVTRMSFAVPAPLFDNYGVPIRKLFDCMM